MEIWKRVLFVHFDTSTVVSVCNCISRASAKCMYLCARTIPDSVQKADHFLTNYFTRALALLWLRKFRVSTAVKISPWMVAHQRNVFLSAVHQHLYLFNVNCRIERLFIIYTAHTVRGSEGVFVRALYNTPRWGWFQALKIMLQRGKILLHNCRASKYWYKMLDRACTTRCCEREPLLGELNYVAHEDTRIW